MTIPKPYKRIIRPFVSKNQFDYLNGTIDNCHILDSQYASDRISLIRAYHLLEKDLMTLFDFVEPSDDNSKVFSHRIYELFLRASTEFEANCKGILKANNYKGKKNSNIEDFFELNQHSRLSEYEIKVSIWNGNNLKVLKPLDDWSKGYTLSWYQSYNNVKHNRSDSFQLASLENLLKAVASVFVVLCSQFYVLVYEVNTHTSMLSMDDNEFWYSHDNSIFSIKLPRTWKPDEYYDFKWSSLKGTPNPFENAF